MKMEKAEMIKALEETSEALEITLGRLGCCGNGDGKDHKAETSIALRDYFAGQALQAIISKLPVIDQEGVFGKPVLDKVKYNRDIAISSYAIADAMMKEKNVNLK